MAITKVSRGLLSTGIVDNSNATAITIDSSEQVGIGIGSPSTPLHIKGAGDAYITIEAGAADGNVGLLFDNSSSTQKGALLYDTDDNYLLFNVNAAERMRIHSSGHVSINGTANASADSLSKLTVGGGSGDSGISIYSGTSSVGRFMFADGTSGNAQYNGFLDFTHSDSSLGMGVNGSRMLVINSSGNVSIGNTSPASRLHVSGNFQVNTTAADSNENRFKVIPGGAGDNCTVQIIQDDASTVGVYLQADGPSWFTGGINPGSGTTTAANVLDDYEEGTWTPSLRAGSSALTVSYAHGPTARYTKIGRMVHIHLGLRLSSVSGTSGTVLRIYGLPYANIATGGYQEDRLSAFLAHNPTADHAGNMFGFVGNGTSYLEFRYLDGGDTVLPSNGLDSDTAISVYGIYYTSS